jgi:hypothetical protein
MVTSTLGRALALAALAALMLAVQAFAQRFELPVEKDRTFGSGRGALAQGWLRLGADRTFEFTVTDGVIPPSLVTFLWEHLPNPVVTAVSPAVATTAQMSVPVKLRQRLQGSHGVLELRERRLTYVTDRAEHQRVWRPADLRMVYQPGRARLNVDAYEGGADRTRTFSFDLKEPLPPGFLESLWLWLYEPSDARTADRIAP